MKNIILSTILVLVAATVFASTQTQTTQDKPWQVYVLGAAMNTSDNNHSIENDYFYPDYPQSNLLYTVDSQTTSGTSVAWLNGLGGSGSGAFLDSSISDGFFYTYTNYDNSGENDSINLDWSGVGSDYQTYPKWGSDSGNSYDYTNFYSINSYVTISSYVVNEHCDVTVPQAQRPFLSYLETGTTIGDVLKQVTETETYQRYAQAAWHVRTGGKAIPGRQSLWQFSGWAQSVTNMRAGPPYNAGDTQPVTNPKAIALGDIGNLQSDGTLWRTLPDNSDTDITPTISGNNFYQFGVSGTKYTLAIGFGGNDVTDSNSTVIVGQLINPACGWLGGSGPAITNYSWTVPGYAIKQFYVSSFPYTNGYPILLTDQDETNSYVNCYWADQGSKQVSCTALVHGQTMTRYTTFNVVKPTASITATTGTVNLGLNVNNIPNSFGITFGTHGDPGILLTNTITLPPGTNYNSGDQTFSEEWVQTIKPIYYTEEDVSNEFGTAPIIMDITNEVVLDNTYPFGYSQSYPWPDKDDSPTVGLHGFYAGSLEQHSETWLMFKPDGGGWVPLRIVDWYCKGSAHMQGTGWLLDSASWSTNPPDMDSGTRYPVWTNNVTQVGYQ